MSAGDKGRPETAAEFMARLSKDPDYLASQARRDAELADRRELLASAEAPIIDDLRSVGIEVSSVWDLVNTAGPYEAALPVLIQHLQFGRYPDRVMESLGRALAVREALRYWDTLLPMLRDPNSGPGKREGLAVALSAIAGKGQFDDLVDILQDTSLHQDRIFFVRPIICLGGERGREVVRDLLDDPELFVEADAALKGRRSND